MVNYIGVEILGDGVPFEEKNYLSSLEANPFIKIDDTSFIHKRNKPEKMKHDLKKYYDRKINHLSQMTIKDFLTHQGQKNYYECIPIKDIKLKWPYAYPKQYKDNEKMAHISRINDAYRFGGNIHYEDNESENTNLSDGTFYVFWVDLQKGDLYKH